MYFLSFFKKLKNVRYANEKRSTIFAEISVHGKVSLAIHDWKDCEINHFSFIKKHRFTLNFTSCAGLKDFRINFLEFLRAGYLISVFKKIRYTMRIFMLYINFNSARFLNNKAGMSFSWIEESWLFTVNKNFPLKSKHDI